ASVITIADNAKAEGNAGTSNLDFMVSLGTPSPSTVTVHYATSDGSAHEPGDYTNSSGTVTFNPGQTSKPVSVPIVGDTTVEDNGTFRGTLSSPTKATMADDTATGTITNDDLSAISIADNSKAEGNAGTSNLDFTVSLDQPSFSTVTVHYATSDGSAH